MSQCNDEKIYVLIRPRMCKWRFFIAGMKIWYLIFTCNSSFAIDKFQQIICSFKINFVIVYYDVKYGYKNFLNVGWIWGKLLFSPTKNSGGGK